MDINYHQLLEWLTKKSLELTQDEHTTKYAMKSKLTKKEYKIILHLFADGEIDEIAEKLNLDQKRVSELLESARKKVVSNLGKFAKI